MPRATPRRCVCNQHLNFLEFQSRRGHMSCSRSLYCHAEAQWQSSSASTNVHHDCQAKAIITQTHCVTVGGALKCDRLRDIVDGAFNTSNVALLGCCLGTCFSCKQSMLEHSSSRASALQCLLLSFVNSLHLLDASN